MEMVSIVGIAIVAMLFIFLASDIKLKVE
jgi:hypothetical protein